MNLEGRPCFYLPYGLIDQVLRSIQASYNLQRPKMMEPVMFPDQELPFIFLPWLLETNVETPDISPLSFALSDFVETAADEELPWYPVPPVQQCGYQLSHADSPTSLVSASTATALDDGMPITHSFQLDHL